VSVRPVLDRWPNFRELLLKDYKDYDEAFTSLRMAEGIGRPLGTADFVIELERRLGRSIARRA
jgi:putative transposase